MANHLQIPNKLFEAISAFGLSKNERRIVDLIIRCSFGCKGKEKANLIQRDFTVTGIKEPHIRALLEKLERKEVIFWDREKKLFWINGELTESVSYTEERFTEILSKNLRKKKPDTYKDVKEKLTYLVGTEKHLSLSGSQKTEPKDNKEILKTKKTEVEKVKAHIKKNLEEAKRGGKYDTGNHKKSQ